MHKSKSIFLKRPEITQVRTEYSQTHKSRITTVNGQERHLMSGADFLMGYLDQGHSIDQNQFHQNKLQENLNKFRKRRTLNNIQQLEIPEQVNTQNDYSNINPQKPQFEQEPNNVSLTPKSESILETQGKMSIVQKSKIMDERLQVSRKEIIEMQVGHVFTSSNMHQQHSKSCFERSDSNGNISKSRRVPQGFSKIIGYNEKDKPDMSVDSYIRKISKL